MPTSRERRGVERGRHELVRLAHAGLGRREFLDRAADALAVAVQFDGACWHTHDPATLLITSHETNLDGSGFAFICRNEYAQKDLNKFAELAHGSPRRCSTRARACASASSTRRAGGGASFARRSARRARGPA